LKKLGNELNK